MNGNFWSTFVSNMKRLAILVLLLTSSIWAQNPNWSSMLMLDQYQSPYFSDWQRDPSIGTFTLNYFVGTEPISVKFKVQISLPEYGVAVEGMTSEVDFLPPTQIFTFNDISDWNDVNINSDLEKVVMQTGKLPESEYSICVQTFSTGNELLTETCTQFDIAIPNPPELISPEDEGSTELAQPTFMWNPINIPPDVMVYYNFKLVQLLEGQTKYRAIQSNIPILEEEIINTNIYIYQFDDYPLEENSSYAWQVQAVNDEGMPLSTNNGYSDIFSFTYGTTSTEFNLDTLEIIENVAYLIDINQLSVVNNEAFYTLDGITTLLFTKSDGSKAQLDVSVQNVMVQQFGDDKPILLGGNINGDFVDDIFPPSITGAYFNPRSFDLQIPDQFMINGVLNIGDQTEIPLSGNLQYEDGNLNGELMAMAADGISLLSFGNEMLQYNISSAMLKFPSLEIDFTGAFSFFGGMPMAMSDEFTMSSNGDFAFNISSEMPIEVPLYSASDFLKLVINSYQGSVSGNISTQKYNFNVLTDSKIEFSANPDNSFGADLELSFSPNSMKVISFSPSGDFENNYLDLGWLKFKMERMKLNSLSYANSEWDFDFSFDAKFNLPNFSAMDFPKLTDVSLNKNGFVFPAFDFDNFSIPNIDFAGFGLEIYGLRMQSYTFDLSTWTPGSIANFSFDFDSYLTFPNFPEGSAAEFFGDGIKLSPNITGGKFNFEIPEIDFPSSLNLNLLDDFKFQVTNMLGSIGSDYDGINFSYLPNINLKGNLVIPEGFGCEDGEESTLTLKSALTVDGFGKLSGVVSNVIPECPIDLGAVSLQFGNSQLEFAVDETQKIILEGTAGIKFTNSQQDKPIGKLSAKYDILNNNLIYLNGSINDKFRWDIGGENPILSFMIQSATIDNNILEIDGRNSVLFGSTNLGVTFDQFQLNLNNFNVLSGQILFDTGFNLKLSGIENGELDLITLPKGTKLNGEAGLMLSFPDQISISKDGIKVIGDGTAEVNFNGKNYSGIGVKFSSDFAFNLENFNVKNGIAEFFHKGNRLAYWDESGFVPDINFFLNYIIPDRIPLPTLDIAYLQIRENDSLLVRVVPNGDEITVSTFEGQPIPLVFTGLQFDKPLPPQIDVTFSLTVNTNSEAVTGGQLFVNIPEEFRDDFDLAQIGIPYQIHSIFYGEIEGDYGFKLVGKAKLFETELSCSDSLSLTITNAGNLIGSVDCALGTTIPMVPESNKLNLVMNRITGEFNVDLLSRTIDYDFALDSDIRFQLDESRTWGVWTLLGVTPDGIEFRDSRVDSVAIPKISLPNFDIAMSNLSLPNLSFTNGANGSSGTWNFEFGMDVDMSFPQFGFSIKLPSADGMSLTRSGFHFPNISISDLPDSLSFDLSGFLIHPTGFRFPQIDFNWFDPLSSEIDWNFAFDLNVDLPKVVGDIRTLSFSDVHFNAGMFIGEFPAINFGLGDLVLPMGNGLDFNITGITTNFFNNEGSQGFNFGFKGQLKMPEFATCENSDGTIYDISETEFTFGSNGFLSGRIESFAPTCPINLGFGKFNITSSSLDFAANDSSQSAIIDMRGALKIPTGGQDTVTASGLLVMNLVNGELIDGEVRIDEQFVLNLPKENPVLRFTVNSAVYNQNGLSINGNSQILLSGGNTLPVNFQDFMFDPIHFRVLSGSITIADSLALLLKLEDDGVDYSVVPYNFVLTENRTAKVGLKGGVTIDANGISANGEALAAINWSEEFNFNGLRADFSDDFKMKTEPFGVEEGKVDIFRNEDKVATYDNSGLHLGDIFGIIPLPERISLPSEEIAYLQIKNGETVLVQTESVPNGMRVQTRDGQPVKLVIPGLKYGDETAPEFNVIFNVVVNTAERRIIEGEIIVLPTEDNSSLLNLRSKGIPVDIKRIRYGKDADDNYGLTTKIKFDIPKALGDFPVELNDLEINRNGIAGNINLGQYSENYPVRELPTLASSLVGDNALITLEGIEAAFGADKAFRFSGKFIPKVFVEDGDTSKIHYSASWNNVENKFAFGLDLAEGQDIELGIAKFIPKPFGTLPAMQLEFTESPEPNFALIINGQITFDGFGDANEFSLDFRNMRITKNDFSVDNLSLPNISDSLQFELFKSKFQIYDIVLNGTNYPGISFSYNAGVFKVELAGKLNFFDKEITFAGLGIDTRGNFTMPNVDFISAPLVVVDNFLTLTKVKLNNNKLDIGGSAKLPKPAADDNHFDFNFSINPDGTFEGLSGNDEFVFIDETRGGLGGGDASEYNFWIGNFDARYLSLTLDFEHMQQSSIKMVADVYFNDKAIGIGNRGVGTITPGFEVDFHGNIDWGTISIPESYRNIYWEMLELEIDEVLINEGRNFNLEFTGNAGLNIAGVGGGLDFGGTDRGGMRITSGGSVENFSNSISGGEFSIVDVITVTVNDIGFSDSPTQITYTSNNSSGGNSAAQDRTIDVDNYFSFGGNIDIAGFMHGGVDRMLSYNSGGKYVLLIENANIGVNGVFESSMDLIYEDTGSGYKVLAGATGMLMNQFDITIVGKMSSGSFGLFIATDGLIIPVGPVVITGLGGGFFYNPEEEDILLVKNKLGLNNPSVNAKVSVPDDAPFAVFLYGAVAFLDDAIIEGRVLLTVAGRYFALDGELIFLSLEDQLYGTVSLQVDMGRGSLDGNIEVFLNVEHLVDGHGGLAFYIYGTDTWGIIGDADVNVLSFFEISSHLFIGPPGFLLNMSAEAGFDVWIIEVRAGFESQIWYLENISWGAYAEARVSAELWAGIASAKGWLKCALFGAPRFYLYGEAGVKVSVFGFSGSASVWAKISNGGVDGGRGSDSEMSRLIDEAKGVSEEAQAQADAIMEDINNQVPPTPETFMLSEEQLAAAFNNLSEWGRKYKYGNDAERAAAWQFFDQFRNVEVRMTGVPVYTGMDGEWDLYRLVLNEIYKGEQAPHLRNFTPTFNSLDSSITDYAQIRSEYVSNFDGTMEAIEPVSFEIDTLSGSPLDLTNFNEPQFETYIDSNGVERQRYLPGTQPDFSVDEEMLAENQSTLTEGMQKAAVYEAHVANQIGRINQNIIKIENVLRGEDGNGGAEKLSSSYTGMITRIGGAFSLKYAYDKGLYFWSEQVKNDLASNAASIYMIMDRKAAFVYDRWGWEKLAYLVSARTYWLAYLSGDENAEDLQTQTMQEWINYHQDPNVLSAQFRIELINSARELGIQLWQTLPIAGLVNLHEATGDLVNADVNTERNNIRELRQFQAGFTNKMDDLYATLSDMYELKYDILNHYIYWKQTNDENAAVYIAQQNEISALMELPTISQLRAVNVDMGMYSNSIIDWSISGANQNNTRFLVDYEQDGPTELLQGYGALGRSRYFSIVNLPVTSRTNFGEITFYLKARTKIGYSIERTLAFTPTFSNLDYVSFGDIVVTESESDFTPPVVSEYLDFSEHYHELPLSETGSYKKIYVGNPNILQANFSAFDEQSGIQEYLYKLVEVTNPLPSGAFQIMPGGIQPIGIQPIGISPVVSNPDFVPVLIPGTTFYMPCQTNNLVQTIIPQTTNLGRDNVMLNTITLEDGHAYKLIVSAVNGDGVSSASCGGMKQYIIVDTTPPTSINLLVSDTRQIPSIINSFTTVNPAEPLPTLRGGGYRFNKIIYTGERDLSGLNYILTWSEAGDEQSGLLRYEYKVTNKNNPAQTSDWVSTGVNRVAVLRNNDATGIDFINYVDSFYVDVRAVNYAEVPGESFRHTFRQADVSRPTAPDVAFAYSTIYDKLRLEQRATILFKTHSLDPQSGIDYYEVAVGSAPNGVLDYVWWGDSIHIKPSEISIIGTYQLPELPANSRNYIAVRAVNKQGARSRYCYAGPYYKDETKPLTPSVALDKFSVNGRIVLSMEFSNIRDLESEITKVEYKVLKQSPGSSSWSIVQNWTESPTLTSAGLEVTNLGVNLSHKIKVFVRSTNAVGLESVTGVGELLLDTTPPETPGLELSVIGPLNKRTLKLTFSNLSDPESGVERVEYMIQKRRIPSYLGFRNITTWLSNDVDLTKNILPSQYNLSSGDYIRVKARVINRNGLVSTITSRVISIN